jgi:hypothetical protein
MPLNCQIFYLSNPIEIQIRIYHKKIRNNMKRILIVLAALACMAISCNTSSSTTANADTSSSNMSSSNTDMLERNKQTALACQQGVTNHDATRI